MSVFYLKIIFIQLKLAVVLHNRSIYDRIFDSQEENNYDFLQTYILTVVFGTHRTTCH